MKVIGITGGVGAGKSTVLNYIREKYNCRIIFADDLAKELEKKGNVCYLPLIELLGEDILSEDGEINPFKMASVIYVNPQLLSGVNSIVHPAVKDAVVKEIDSEKEKGLHDYFFLEAAHLIGCGYKDIVDEMWYIRADESVRRERLKSSRGYSDEKIDKILSSQLSDEMFVSNSDVVINNGYDFSETCRQIDSFLWK